MRIIKWLISFIFVINIIGCSTIRVTDENIVTTRGSAEKGFLLVTIAQSGGSLVNYRIAKIENGKLSESRGLLHQPFNTIGDLEDGKLGKIILEELASGSYLITEFIGGSSGYIANYGGTTVYVPGSTAKTRKDYLVRIFPGRINYAGEIFSTYDLKEKKRNYEVLNQSSRDYEFVMNKLPSVKREDFLINLAKELRINGENVGP